MNSLLSDLFIQHFLKGLYRASKPGSPLEMEALERSDPEKFQAPNDLEKTENREKADKQSKQGTK